MTITNTSVPQSYEGGLSSALWELTASYAFVDVVSTGEGNLEKVPGFLRVGCEAVLQRPVLELRHQELTSNQLRILSACMPHLREVNLRGSVVDGTMCCHFISPLKRIFTHQPSIKIVGSSLEDMYKQYLPRIIERDIQAMRTEKARLETERQRIIVVDKPEEIDKELKDAVDAIHAREEFLREITSWQSTSPSFQQFVQDIRRRSLIEQFMREELVPAQITLISASTSRDEKKEAYACMERIMAVACEANTFRMSVRTMIVSTKDDANKESWIYRYAKICEQESVMHEALIMKSSFEQEFTDLRNSREQELTAAVQSGKISEAQCATLRRLTNAGNLALLPQFLAKHKPQE